ncbi:MAG: Ig-like domain-containing protein [Porticoccus sp.]
MTLCNLRVAAFSCGLLILALLMSIYSTAALAAKPEGKGKGSGGGGGGTTTSYVPMSLEYENYDFRNLSGDNSCLGEDDDLSWQATGSLAPGESFSFTPQYPACNGHPAVISAVSSWTGGMLELTSQVPDNDFATGDQNQVGQLISAPVVGQAAQLCMFPAYASDDLDYTITITNNSANTVHDVVLEGRNENDWPLYYYERCIHADADGDGWNDSLEHTMANLVYPNGYLNGEIQTNILWGSNYLLERSESTEPDDEVDAYPPDFNDDGSVNHMDQLKLQSYLGQGNGIPLSSISPNSTDAEWYHYNTAPWRRYDLDGDGFVGDEDVAIVETLLNQPVPMDTDMVAPTARVLMPEQGPVVSKGQYFLIEGHAWDNASLTRVDYQVDGKTICSNTNPLPGFGFTSPFYQCWWDVPKRRGSYALTIVAYDGEGNVTTSPELLVSSQ